MSETKDFINLPCKDCITKVICRNELYKKLLEETSIYRKKFEQVIIRVFIPYSIYYSLCKKCILLKASWIEHRDNDSILPGLGVSLIEEFKIDTKQIMNEFIKSEEKLIERLIGSKNYYIKYDYDFTIIIKK